ncbi:MAG TPA: hypothetical protein QF650_01510 [Vicinamibacterales bacterium]|jgi:cytoskeletal protein RodZ|nr:hypothetical protein [Vicinamibacterales bacterium]|tara:strand:- start:2060 stop:2551 length:492 start_codon:yes stop_codon:yes gene_type:complete
MAMVAMTGMAGVVGASLATAATAQVGPSQAALRDLGAVRVEIEMARNPGAARRGVDPDYVRDTVERRVDQLDLELAQGEATDDGPYLSILLNPARVTDGFAVDLSIRLFQPATLANGETVMAATWHAESFEVSTAENLQDYVRNVLQAHLETLGTDHRAANEP